jgi:hypothetical protein
VSVACVAEAPVGYFTLLRVAGLSMNYRQPRLFVLHVLQSGLVHSCGKSFSVSSRPPIINQRNEILPLDLTFESQDFRAFTAPRTYVPGVIVARFKRDIEILFRPSAE